MANVFDVEERKTELKLLLMDIRVEAKHLINNIDIALDHLEEVKTLDDAIKYDEEFNIAHGLKYIEIV